MTGDRVAHRFAWLTFATVLTSVLTAWADPAAGRLCNALGLLLCAAWLFLRGWRSGFPPLFAPVALIPLWGMCQLAFHLTVYSHVTWQEVASWSAQFAFLYLGFAALQDRETRESILSTLLACAVCLASLGMLQWFTAGGRVLWLFDTPYEGEVMATFLNRDHYAVFVELVLPIALARALFDTQTPIRYTVAAGLLYASVVTTGSRAGTALVTGEAGLLILISLARRGWDLRRVWLMAAVLLGASFAAGWEYLLFRLRQPDLFTFRREMALATIDMIRDRPLAGFGLGTWPTVYPGYALFDPPGFYMNHAHNEWLEWAAEGGLPMALLCLIIAWYAILLARRNLWALGVPVAFLHAALDFPMRKPAVAATLFFVLGAAAAAEHFQMRGQPRRRRRRPALSGITVETTMELAGVDGKGGPVCGLRAEQ